MELDEFYTVNITSSPTSSAPIITLRFELAGPPSEVKNSASEVNIFLKVVCCRIRLADRACSRCSALPLRKACWDQWDPLVHASRPLLRPHLPYVRGTLCKASVDPAAHDPMLCSMRVEHAGPAFRVV